MTGPTGGAGDRQWSEDLARSLAGILEYAHQQLSGRGLTSATSRLLSAHLRCDLEAAVLVATDLPPWQHVSAQRGIEAYAAERGDPVDWHGLTAMHRDHMELIPLLVTEAASGSSTVAAPEFTSAATGPAEQIEVVSFGLLCTHDPAQVPVVVLLRSHARHGPPALEFVVLAADRATAATATERIRALIEQHDIIRGQVVSFGSSEHYGNAYVTFLPRPELTADDIVLAPDVLPVIERHILSTGANAQVLRRAGIHLKRGLLLYGPPGTGKTHTVRYLMSRAADSTIIVLSGTSLGYIEQAAALARRVAPTVVVVEDVDLIGRDRSFSPDGNPLLFTLLDAMDGVAADADVTFLLTTNRPADLESALVQRPGRIDLAVEIPLPDAEARRTLLRLYAGRAELAADLGPAVEATEGATASAMKELMRRCVLAAIEAGSQGSSGQPEITDAMLAGAVEVFLADAQTLTRALLGAGGDAAGTAFDAAVDQGDDTYGSGPVQYAGPGIVTGGSVGWTGYPPGPGMAGPGVYLG